MSLTHRFESTPERELLYFWAFGDLHYRTLPAWQAVHTQRLAPMFEDLQALWQEQGTPSFCVSPGDLVETSTLENHQLAQLDLATKLGGLPFYTGIGNHEFFIPGAQVAGNIEQTYTSVWEKPVRYSWQTGDIVSIMLDYPDPFTLEKAEFVYVSQETLAFLDQSLAENADKLAVIFLHCPLRNTVLGRDQERHPDYNSQQNFFSPENSQAVRDILARHNNACLYFSGHTHSGWEAPNLVCTEELGGHRVTFVNLMSPWYTGIQTGPRVSEGGAVVHFIQDEPDVVPTFAVRMYEHHAVIRVRDHNTKQWLKEWIVPLH